MTFEGYGVVYRIIQRYLMCVRSRQRLRGSVEVRSSKTVQRCKRKLEAQSRVCVEKNEKANTRIVSISLRQHASEAFAVGAENPKREREFPFLNGLHFRARRRARHAQHRRHSKLDLIRYLEVQPYLIITYSLSITLEVQRLALLTSTLSQHVTIVATMSTYGNKPIMGYAFKFNDSLISWSSKRGTLVTLSVTEAELYALAHASTEAVYLKGFISEILNTQLEPITIHTDSASTLAILRTPEEQHTQRTKHFEIRKNFIIDRIAQKYITVQHVPTNEQLADLLTKALSSDKNKRFSQLLGIRT